MKVSSIILGKRVETISASASIHDLVNTLNSHHIGALVVSSDGKRIDGADFVVEVGKLPRPAWMDWSLWSVLIFALFLLRRTIAKWFGLAPPSEP